MLNGNWYRMTEKQGLESPSEPGIEFEAFNISEAKRIHPAAEGEGDRAGPGGIDGQAARCVNQRCAWKMDGRGRDIRIRTPHGSGDSSSCASLFRSRRVRSSWRLEPALIQSRSRSGILVPDSDSFVRKMFFSSAGPEYLVENESFPQMRWRYYRITIGIETIGLCYKVPVGLC